MHYAVLCIGSNIPQANDNIIAGLQMLVEATSAEVMSASSLYPSGGGYLNQVALLSVTADYPTLHAATKSIESALGRTPQMKVQNIVPVDIDIVIYDGTVIRPADYKAAFFRKGYRTILG